MFTKEYKDCYAILDPETFTIGNGRQNQLSVDKHGFGELILEKPHSFALYRYEEC